MSNPNNRAGRLGFLVAAALFGASAPSFAKSGILGQPLWVSGERSVWAVQCRPSLSPDEECTEFEARSGQTRVRLPNLRFGYLLPNPDSTKVIWTRPPGGQGPDLVLRGELGTSAGSVQLVAVEFSPEPRLSKLDVIGAEDITASPSPRFSTKVVFELLALNDAWIHGSPTDEVDLTWRQGFVADLSSMRAQTFTEKDLRFREEAIETDLSEFQLTANGAANEHTVLTAKALLDLVLSGRANQAKAMFFRVAGTKALLDADAWWSDFCLAVASNELWPGLGLNRLPHADLIAVDALRGRAHRHGRDYLRPEQNVQP